MKKRYLFGFSIGVISCLNPLIAQEKVAFNQQFEGVRKDLVSWDPVRGAWLAESMQAVASKQPIPDRTFPEAFTPAEMIQILPETTRNSVRNTVQNSANTNRDSSSRTEWNRVNQFIQRSNCKPIMGRTYGDPHLSSFDGASYSFQTVGEFTLVKSASGHMDVQVRQRNQGDDFSLNTAVAMNVAGDRVCFYANEKPDANNTTPLRINGEVIYMDRNVYFLDHGGTIRSSKNDYTVTWPTGEKVQVDMRSTAQMPFMNLAVEIYPCTDQYEGILGNANGRSSDDFDTRGTASRPTNLSVGIFGSSDASGQAMEREYLAFLAKDFARSWRIDQMTSLFDYGFGQSTYAFTDESFPRVHHTLGDLDQKQMGRSRRECERQGLRGAELNACIYDNGFLNVPPTPKPRIDDPTTGVIVRPVVDPKPNVNPGKKPFKEQDPTINTSGNGGAHPRGDSEPKPIEPIVKDPYPIEKPLKEEPVEKEPAISKPVQPKPVDPKPVDPVSPKKPISIGNGTFGTSVKPTPKPNTPSTSNPPAPVSKPAPTIKPAPSIGIKPALKRP